MIIVLFIGKIPFNQPVKVFDIDRFANNLRQELEKKGNALFNLSFLINKLHSSIH